MHIFDIAQKQLSNICKTFCDILLYYWSIVVAINYVSSWFFHIVSALWQFLLCKLNSSRGNYWRGKLFKGGNYSRKCGNFKKLIFTWHGGDIELEDPLHCWSHQPILDKVFWPLYILEFFYTNQFVDFRAPQYNIFVKKYFSNDKVLNSEF